MPVTPSNKSEKIESITGNSTVTEPPGAVLGDVLLALACGDSLTSLTAPAGWTNLYGPTVVGFSTSLVSYISRGASAPNLTWGVGGTGVYREIHIVCLHSSVDSVALDSQSATGATGNSIHFPDPPATTAVAAASLAIAGAVHFQGGGVGGWTPSTGYTVQTVNAAGAEALLESKVLSAAGSENPSAFANGGATSGDWWDGFTTTWKDVGTPFFGVRESHSQFPKPPMQRI